MRKQYTPVVFIHRLTQQSRSWPCLPHEPLAACGGPDRPRAWGQWSAGCGADEDGALARPRLRPGHLAHQRPRYATRAACVNHGRRRLDVQRRWSSRPAHRGAPGRLALFHTLPWPPHPPGARRRAGEKLDQRQAFIAKTYRGRISQKGWLRKVSTRCYITKVETVETPETVETLETLWGRCYIGCRVPACIAGRMRYTAVYVSLRTLA
jgi:hypothetical protein